MANYIHNIINKHEEQYQMELPLSKVLDLLVGEVWKIEGGKAISHRVPHCEGHLWGILSDDHKVDIHFQPTPERVESGGSPVTYIHEDVHLTKYTGWLQRSSLSVKFVRSKYNSRIELDSIHQDLPPITEVIAPLSNDYTKLAGGLLFEIHDDDVKDKLAIILTNAWRVFVEMHAVELTFSLNHTLWLQLVQNKPIMKIDPKGIPYIPKQYKKYLIPIPNVTHIQTVNPSSKVVGGPPLPRAFDFSYYFGQNALNDREFGDTRGFKERFCEFFTVNTKSVIICENINDSDPLLDFETNYKSSSVGCIFCPSCEEKTYRGVAVYTSIDDLVEEYLMYREPEEVAIVVCEMKNKQHACNYIYFLASKGRCLSIIVIDSGYPLQFIQDLTYACMRTKIMLLGPDRDCSIVCPYRWGTRGFKSINPTKGTVGLITRTLEQFEVASAIIDKRTHGLFEGIALGRDTISSNFSDQMFRFMNMAAIHIVVIIGDGNENQIHEEIKNIISMDMMGLVTKPLVMWTNSSVVNRMLCDNKCRVIVPPSYDELEETIARVYSSSQISMKKGVDSTVESLTDFMTKLGINTNDVDESGNVTIAEELRDLSSSIQ